MSTAAQLNAELARLRDLVQPQLDAIASLERQYRTALSVEFIAAHGITADKVQRCDVPGMWFGNVWKYSEWLVATNCTKPWAEWNGLLYPTGGLKTGDMRFDAVGRIEHVPGAKP